MLRLVAGSVVLVVLVIGAYVLGTFYPNSHVQQAPVIPTHQTVTPGSEQAAASPRIDPDVAMRYVLVQAGIDTSSLSGQFYLSRAGAVQGMFEIQTGTFSGYSSQALVAFMQDWVTYMNAPGTSEYVQNAEQIYSKQIPAKADEILSSPESGTLGGTFRELVRQEVAATSRPESDIYWDRVIVPAIVGQNLSETGMMARQGQFNRLADDYKLDVFSNPAQASDFGVYLAEHGLRLSRD